MKTFRQLLTCVAFLALSVICGAKGHDSVLSKDQSAEFISQMSKAYGYFLKNDRMPETIKVKGVVFDSGMMLSASFSLVQKMMAEPKAWKGSDIRYSASYPCPDNERNNTLDIDEISLAEFMRLAGNAHVYAEKNNKFPNYCTVNADHRDPDGSVYPTQMIINAISVGFARIFHHYKQHGTLPEKVSTWHSGFLRSTNNSPKEHSLVKSTARKVTKGLKTDYDKAKALFEYARDAWEWQNYSNTGKGAVKTIKDKGANCCDLSHTLIAMCRAVGIPARYRHAQCKYIKSGKVIGHVMAEVYVNGKWYLCDPSSNQDTFGNHEAWSHMDTFNGRYRELPF